MRERVLSMTLGVLVAVSATTACVGAIGDSGSGRAGEASAGDGGAASGSGSTTSAACTDVGTVTLHRLNNTEYDNTIFDLLDNSHPAAANFPTDDTSFGFDNNADVLPISPLLLEAHDTVAQTLVQSAWGESAHASIMICTPTSASDACTRRVLGSFAKRVWRRPVTDQELTELLQRVALVTTQCDTLDAGIQLALRVILVSPNFIYRTELIPSDVDDSAPLGDYELASRLSYFLWSTMPDAPLLAAADAGSLTSDPGELARQAARMLADPRAQSLADTFALQWMTAGLNESQPSPMIYPSFDGALRGAMLGETREFMRSFMFDDVNFLDLIDAPYTWANRAPRTALRSGRSHRDGHDARKARSEHPSGGLLTQASVLTVTSIPNRTSPTRRGKWVLSNLLCDPPQPPPPNVPPLPAIPASATLRDILEQHRKNPACSTCHSKMDPIGLGIENFDGIGAWRDTDRGLPIDPTGDLTTDTEAETPYSGTLELESLIKSDPRFAQCVTSKLYAFAIGRAPTSTADRCRVKSLTTTFQGQNFRMKDFLMTVIKDDAFRMRRGGA